MSDNDIIYLLYIHLYSIKPQKPLRDKKYMFLIIIFINKAMYFAIFLFIFS